MAVETNEDRLAYVWASLIGHNVEVVTTSDTRHTGVLVQMRKDAIQLEEHRGKVCTYSDFRRSRAPQGVSAGC
jgi:hypothetical protein